MSPMKQSFWQSPLTRSSVPKDKVTTPETLLGYLIGPFGALLSSGSSPVTFRFISARRWN